MTGFAAELRAGGPVPICRRGLWLTFLSPFGLEVAAACGADGWDNLRGLTDQCLGGRGIVRAPVG